MKATEELHNLGQSLWLDNITRDLLDNGTLKRYIDEFSVSGLTSNPTIFEHAISKSKSYDDEIVHLASKGLSGEELFFELALQDSTGTKDPKASDVLYIGALAAPNTVNTIPEKTLLAFADHGKLTGTLPRDGGDCEVVLNEFRKAGIDLDQLAADLQSNGAKAFDKSWEELLNAIDSKSKQLKLAS